MTAYEFTRFDADFTSKVKVKDLMFCTRTLASSIEKAHTNNAREKAEYKDAENIFLDCTMSCNKSEAINWMKYWMSNAIAYGLQTRNPDWQYKFLAAYDLFNSLTA